MDCLRIHKDGLDPLDHQRQILGGFFITKMSFILAKKVKMTQIWKDGKIVPVTVVRAEPNKVSLVRTNEKDGYSAVQVQLGKKKMEFLTKEGESFEVGQEIAVSTFTEGEDVTISGLSKGRGFQGGVKRHGFHGGPKTHGQKNRYRAPGSIGSTAPQRVLPGRRMAGHFGMERNTRKNVQIVQIDAENNYLMLKGAVPGGPGTFVEIFKA